MLEAVSFTTALLPVNLTTGKPSESVTFAVTDGMVMPWYGLLASDTVAACAIVTVSLCVSESERAKTLIVCGVLQLPLLPPVNVSVAEEPKELVSFLTRTAVWSPDVAVTVTVAPGSEFRDTSYVCKGFVSMIESDEALTDTPGLSVAGGGSSSKTVITVLRGTPSTVGFDVPATTDSVK